MNRPDPTTPTRAQEPPESPSAGSGGTLRPDLDALEERARRLYYGGLYGLPLELLVLINYARELERLLEARDETP